MSKHMVVNTCHISRRMEVRRVSNSYNDLQGHSRSNWYWCNCKHIRSLSTELGLRASHHLSLKNWRWSRLEGRGFRASLLRYLYIVKRSCPTSTVNNWYQMCQIVILLHWLRTIVHCTLLSTSDQHLSYISSLTPTHHVFLGYPFCRILSTSNVDNVWFNQRRR